MAEGDDDRTELAQLHRLVSYIQVAMLTTVDEEGRLHSRPMATRGMASDGTLWFVTSLESSKVEEVSRDQRVSVTYADARRHRFVAVSGRARIVRERARVEELWSEADRNWFPAGPGSPDLALVEVRPERAEYWQGPGRRLVRILGFVKAVTTGRSVDPTENRRLEL